MATWLETAEAANNVQNAAGRVLNTGVEPPANAEDKAEVLVEDAALAVEDAAGVLT